MKKIKLSRGKFAIVDDEDFDWLNQWNWHAGKSYYSQNNFYASRKIGDKKICQFSIFMHRLIMNFPKGLVVDHIDGDGLNNRKSNLRAVTQCINGLNRTKLTKHNTSGFLGVYWNKASKKWQAFIRINKQYVYLGLFKSKVKAAKVVQEKRLSIFDQL